MANQGRTRFETEKHTVVSRDWLAARLALLKREEAQQRSDEKGPPYATS